MIKNLKNIFAPIQEWLLTNKQCVGCGTPLAKGKRQAQNPNTEKITCKCGRIYIYDLKNIKYRRALSEEV
ncbi:hypothetical protein HY030_01155 [Candidatus Gottesmanbacteria bacterium]|nr:hypothetical protein [Candidatus Gottesmanbacteria bacterium]